MGEPPERRFLIVAGEASGDLHAARLVTALRALGPCVVRGVTGPALELAGAERIASIDTLSVIGFSAVVPRLPLIWRTYRRLLDEFARFQPHVCILVDSPGFQFRIGPALKRRGAKILYYIAPQVWAWHASRASSMAAWVDRLAVVFPFEERIFRDAGVDARFVGHPLLDDLAPEVSEREFRAELGVGAEARILGLLPGSRPQEIRQHLPILEAGARLLASSRPDLVSVVAEAAIERGERALVAADAPPGLRVVRGRTRAVQAYATACAVASGTATLETALFGTPLAIVYRVGAINYAIARRVIRLDRIGLPNIVAGMDVAPELLQRNFTASNLAATLAPWLDDAQVRAAARERLAVVRVRLGGPGASAHTAQLAVELADA